MKKLFSLLAVAAMAFTACQNDEGVKNPTLADEGIVNLSVGVPELATRVLDGDEQSGKDSAWGAIDYANYSAFLESEYDVRFQLAVYEANAEEDAAPIYTATNYVDFASTTSFADLRFVPGREYQFVVFADFVPQGTQEDFRYNTADLRNITAFEALNAMDETYDAYFFNGLVKIEAGKVNEVDVTLRRPFGKVRVLTTDLAFVENYAVPAAGEVTFYNHPIYKSFNAVTGEVATEATNAEENKKYDIDLAYYGETVYNGAPATTLFATYILGTEAQETVNFRLDTFEADGTLIKSIDFSTEIPYQRNYLTTIVGNLLTNEADIFVEIDDNFIGGFEKEGDFDNLEEGLGYIREGVLVGDQVYRYETNLFNFRLLSETDGTELREGTYKYGELIQIQNRRAFDIEGINVEKGTLTIAKDGENYNVVFDIYATINGVTENYILTWNGSLKGAREALATPVVTWEVDEVDNLYITFSWEPVEGAKSYTVEFLGEEQTVEGTSATFDFSGQDTTATAYVTANPEYTWSYTASTATVNVEWKKPIMWGEVEVMLSYVNGSEVAFHAEGLNIYVPNYPSLEDAWYQTVGQIPVPFSAEATLEETTGSAASVVIAEPTIATKFVYYGAMNPIVLTNVKIDWVDGANTIVIAFFNEKNEISFHTAVPLAEGEYTIVPETLVVEGGNVPTEGVEATAFVTLKNDVYTVFFQIESAINDILMQYVGGIDFEKPYAPQYVLESYTAGAETIYFESENAEFEIEATSLESGDVVVKKLILDGSDDYVASNQVTAATAVVKEENGVYDARYTVTVKLPIVGAKTFDLQYVGPFVPYSAPVEPAKPIEFEATYEVKAGAYFFTGVGNYAAFSILVNNLATTEYITGETEDAWAYDWTLGQPMNNFRTGDFLTVENNVVTVEFTAAPFGEELRYKMTCDMNPATQEPEDIYLSATVDGTVYTAVEDDYMIDYTDGYANAYYQGKLMGGVTVDVADGADDIEFTFFHEERNANIHIIYNKATVTPNEPLEIPLALDEETGYLVGLYEDTVYTIIDNDEYFAGSIKKGNNVRNGIIITVTDAEDGSGKYYTFYDELNERDVRAFYQTSFGPVDTTVNVTFTKIADGVAFDSYTTKFNLSDEAGNKVSLIVDNGAVAAGKIVDGNYTWADSPQHINSKSTFSFINKTLTVNGATFANADIAGTMTVVDGKITLNMSIFEVAYVLVYTPSNTPVVPDQPTTYEEITLIATYETFIGSVKAYHAEPYWINGDTWMEVEGIPSLTSIKQEEKLESTETNGNVTTFKFTDEVNKKKVTVTYTDETQEPETPAGFDPWTFTALLNTSSKVLTMTDDTNTVVAQLNMLSDGTFYINDNGAKNATIDGEASGTIYIDGSTFKVTIDATINGVKYKGTSTNSAL